MKIILQKKKLALWFGAVFVIISIGCIVLMFHVQRQNFSNTYKEDLQALANEKALLVNTFLESQKEKLEIIASMNVFKEALLYPNDPAKIAIAKNRINELKSIIPGISILTNKGITVIGEVDLPGTDYGQHPYFLAKRRDITFAMYYDPLRKDDYYAIIGPVYGGADRSKIIGRIAFDIELEKISALMKKTPVSKTNEVYLIDETGLLLSDSNYINNDNKNGVLIQEIKSDGAKACLADLKKYKKDGAIEEHKDKVGQYINYMGDEVFGAIAHVPSIMGCVIAEESAKKVLGIYDVK
jgi:C4-dicarboxylate-specific signal transduction histidine kinase